jgi:NADH dehydrogenase
MDERVGLVEGDLLDGPTLEAGMHGCTSVIHLVGIIREKPRQGVTFDRVHREGTIAVVEAARRAGVRRLVHMSALGTRPDAISNYHRTKHQAEQAVQTSGLDWTIIRPSLIHGPGGELMRMEAMWARKKAPPPLFFTPFMPYFGGKRAGRIQPVYVKDVARAFVDAIEKPKTIGRVYELGGPKAMTWPKFHRICARAIVGQERWTAAMPVGVAKLLCAVGIAPLLGFNRDQVIMSLEDNTCDLTKFTDDFGWGPNDFEETLQTYAGRL